MFSFFKKQSTGDHVSFKIDGMHCMSCSMNIDGELEETKGVLESHTNYAKSMTHISFDSTIVTIPELKVVIEKLGYTATLN